ncbi:hypothetical protein MicloDRAFT_00001950 [Microvirga lotononidis]|uniref:Uncharacterized protein n=1 Tax=Microvirga lotononidis TaxID=864069 RepID=I4Z4R3_9HYPH|nr:hypothetical protein MicloDRAFT_00001950 [Microvirga lotononidis]
MRVTIVTALLALSVLSSGVMAQDRAAPEARSLKATPSRPYTAEESAALAAKARQKAEAAERARDRKLREVSKGICTGC